MPHVITFTGYRSINRPQYRLTLWDTKTHWHIQMVITEAPLTTTRFPKTTQILQQFLPTIFLNECSNYEDVSFGTEVRKTELPHLFEHILLEYLCKQKLMLGHNTAEFSGHTDWNWKKEPRGTFHIYVSKMKQDSSLLRTSLKKTICLFERILTSSTQPMYA